jgi:hypothetical protein
MPKAVKEKRKWLSGMIGNLVNSVVPNSAAGTKFIDLGKNARDIPLEEVRMKSKEIEIDDNSLQKGWEGLTLQETL